MQKECTKCKKTKPYESFRKDKTNPTGRTYYCKECFSKMYHEKRHYHRKRNSEYRRNNLEHIKEYLRNLPGEQRRAKSAVNGALKYGKIEKPDFCEVCLSDCLPDGHHDDYSKPLDVMWVCKPCHAYIHRKERTANSRALGE